MKPTLIVVTDSTNSDDVSKELNELINKAMSGAKPSVGVCPVSGGIASLNVGIEDPGATDAPGVIRYTIGYSWS